MNVSAKSEYGLRALIHLARRRDGDPVPAREIAETYRVPVKYLEQILAVLRDGGLVEAQVGSAGGYRLARPPRFMSAGEAIRLLDQRLGLADRPVPRDALPTDPVERLWADVETAILAVVEDVSIADLLEAGQGRARSAS